MSIGILGKKIGMTRVFDQDSGAMTAVTVIEVAGNTWLQVKSTATDGYSAVQVGCDDRKESRVNQPARGHFAKHGTSPKYLVREFRVASDAELPDTSSPHPGAALFEAGQWVDVIGTTKGKGFQGTVRRFKFSGQRMTHGSMMHRRPGAIGCRSTPGLVWKNQKMPGHMGTVRRTTQNLKVVQCRPDDNVLLISGTVPGSKGAYVVVRPAKKKPAAKN
jgi:large subunit ribosomal protein L3